MRLSRLHMTGPGRATKSHSGDVVSLSDYNVKMPLRKTVNVPVDRLNRQGHLWMDVDYCAAAG